MDDIWQAEVTRIYDEYAIYYQSESGAEQVVFDSSGRGIERSVRVLEGLDELHLLPETGYALDVGCGNGAFLRALASSRPCWSMSGSDLSDRFRETVEAIPGVDRLYTCSLDEIEATFDLVSLIHVLEHVPSPTELLADVRTRLRDDGVLLVQVPDATRNPFDLVIADHCSHFSAATLERLLRRAGYTVVALRTDWVAKELSVVARPTAQADLQLKASDGGAGEDPFALTTDHFAWLQEVSRVARELAQHSETVGIFGTSIAAAWLFSEVGQRVDFFVDEDPHRIGRSYMDRPVLHPRDVPPNSDVFLGLAPQLALNIAARLRDKSWLRCRLHLPPGLASSQG